MSLSILTDIFPGEPRLAGFIEAKDDGSGGDNWSYKVWKLQSNRHHQQTDNQLLQAGCLPVAQPKVSKH